MIGLLGGTFNPVHFGHLRMAQELADAIGLDEVRFIPAALPPHRALPEVTTEHRLAMVEIATRDNPLFRVDTRELHRSGFSYTIDTLISQRQEVGETQPLCWLMGSDAFLGLTSWHRWEELLDYCHIVVAYRPSSNEIELGMPEELRGLLGKRQLHDTPKLRSKHAGHIFLQDITALDISATHIRAMLEQDVSPRYLLPDAVLDYIAEHALYRGA